MLLVKKSNFFYYSFSAKIRLQIRSINVLDRKETFFDCKKNIFQSLKNCIFPKGLPMLTVKNANFFHFLCSLKIRLE